MRLRILSTLLGLFVASGSLMAQSGQEFDSHVADFLNKYVEKGLVDYSGIEADKDGLDKLTSAIASTDMTTLSGAEDKAFRINAYNIAVLRAVVDHLPLNSPLDRAGFFDRDKYDFGGKRLTLNQFEKEGLFVDHPDARLHFVLVCAAVSCPELIATPYTAGNLDAQLDRQTRLAINSDVHVRLDASSRKVNVSELFKWYESDFVKEGGSVIGYINKFRDEPIPTDYSVGYITYDWALNSKKKALTPALGAANDDDLNLQAFTPSTLLRPGQYDLKVFNNLYSQTAFFDESASRVETDSRATYFTSIISAQSGLTPRINLGVDLYFKSVLFGASDDSRFSVLRLQNGPDARTTLSSIAPKIKWTPFADRQNLAMQLAVVLPVASDLQGGVSGRPFLDWDSWQSWLQLFYDLSINDKLLAYIEAGMFFRFDTRVDSPKHELIAPFKGILNYYPTSRFTLYGVAELSPSTMNAFYFQTGVGAKYQVTPGFEIETLGTIFPVGKNKGAGQTLNFGFRFVR